MLSSPIVFGAVQRAEGLVGVHGRAEDKAQDAAGFVVGQRCRHLAFADEFEERLGKEIVVVGELALGGESVGERAHLYVKAVERRLSGVMGAAPRRRSPIRHAGCPQAGACCGSSADSIFYCTHPL